MKATEVLRQIQIAIDGVRNDGQSVISVTAMGEFIAKLFDEAETSEAEPTKALTPEQQAQQLEIWKATLASDSMHSVEMFKSVIEAGQTALKSAIVINGGAAAALLAFAGNSVIKGYLVPGQPVLVRFGIAMLIFSIGLTCAGFGTGFRYISQASYAAAMRARRPEGATKSKRWDQLGGAANYVSIAFGVAAFALPVWGAVRAYSALATP
ncbi:hypothetical protein [Pararobbsia silviterrae]|uniref:Uncharacterized protein n=1 Tax=Pararobbsia silviterrae TaxID=1792498 RepID=A0A494Y7K0_9BURK|nr:hypothetical protein [Pararobbsia silviterrae]RKP58624.1 hypothetical protein D7S86_01385 [Pararobbsia silviterrae]